MGCGSSKKGFQVNNDIEGQSQSAIEVFMSIGLTISDLDKMYHAFNEIDADHSNTVRAAELFAYFNLDSGTFENHVFSVFDEDNSGVLNFMEFVCCMWNLLTLGDKDLGILAYLMKDPTGCMRIRYADVKDLMEIMHKKKIEASPALTTLYNNLKKTCPSEISIQDFCKWTAANSTVLSPLLILQLKLRKQIIGESFWIRLCTERHENSEQGDFAFVKQLQALLRKKNAEFKNARLDAEAKKLREGKRGGNSSEYAKNVERKQSVLLGAFNMKGTKSNSRGTVVPVMNSNQPEHSDLTKSSSSLKYKPEPTAPAPAPETTVSTSTKSGKRSRDNNKSVTFTSSGNSAKVASTGSTKSRKTVKE